MIFIKDLIKITDEKYSIGFIHYMPFDNNSGLGKTEEELEKEGILTDLPIQGSGTLYYNPIEKKCFYDDQTDTTIVPDNDPSLKEQLDSLGKTVAEEKLKNMQKDKTISSLGSQIAELKISIIKLQGGTN